MTKRNQILEAFKDSLATVTDLKTITVERSMPSDVDQVDLPAVFIYGGPEVRLQDNRAVIGQETFEWVIFIELWAMGDTDMEELLGLIHTALFANETMGGLCPYSYRTGVTPYLIDPDRQVQMTLLEWTVLYRHPLGQP